MPANLNERDGRIACMVVGKPAWHGLGTVLERPANAAEAIEAAKLAWRVVKKPLFAGENEYRPIPDYFSIVHESDWNSNKGTVLGIVGKGYTPLQNRDAFTFFDPIVGQGAAVYHTAGALGNGERVWILAKLPGEIRVIADDITNKYLLLSNSHDGKSAVQIKFTPIRVVCENTLTQALRSGPTLRVAHTKDIEKRLKIAALLLQAIQYRFTEIEGVFRATAGVKMDQQRLGQYLFDVFPDPRGTHGDERYERALAQAQYDRAAAEYYFAAGRGSDLPGVKGTLWAAYNGVAEYVDYAKFAKGSGDRQLSSIWFGDGYSIKARAFVAAEKSLAAWVR